MIKRILLAVVALSLFSTSVFAQDIFVTFSQGAEARTSSNAAVDLADGSGTAFVYSDIAFDAFDLKFSTSDDSVIQFTGVTVPNSFYGGPPFGGAYRWDADPIGELFSDTSGRMFGVAVLEVGLDPLHGPAFEDFDVAAGAPLVGTIDFDIVGTGTADITLALGNLGFIDLPDTILYPSFGNGSLTVTRAVPEPSTVGILALGVFSFVARRRR